MEEYQEILINKNITNPKSILDNYKFRFVCYLISLLSMFVLTILTIIGIFGLFFDLFLASYLSLLSILLIVSMLSIIIGKCFPISTLTVWELYITQSLRSPEIRNKTLLVMTGIILSVVFLLIIGAMAGSYYLLKIMIGFLILNITYIAFGGTLFLVLFRNSEYMSV